MLNTMIEKWSSVQHSIRHGKPSDYAIYNYTVWSN